MRCFLKGPIASPLAQFSDIPEHENDPGDGGGIPVFSSFSITYFGTFFVPVNILMINGLISCYYEVDLRLLVTEDHDLLLCFLLLLRLADENFHFLEAGVSWCILFQFFLSITPVYNYAVVDCRIILNLSLNVHKGT